ncbi:response regulator [bacterium SCSIO 12741]|nr:response regulator [bacterium SCSIO 12741]
MSKVRVLVVEDEAIIAQDIQDTLEDLGYEVFEPANTYTEAVELLETVQPDIAILDIRLAGQKSGVDIANHINENYHFPFIFLSSNTDKLTLDEAKKVEPLAYLVKPFSKDELYTSIELALYNFSKSQEKFLDPESLIIKDALFIKDNRVFSRINFCDILYLRSDHVYLDIYLKNDKKQSVRGGLNTYINKLSPSFFRTHRSCIVNLEYLEAVNHNNVVINGEELPIGKKQRDDLLQRLNRG